MICPRCQQGVQNLREGRCPYCQYACAEFHRKVTSVQVVLGAIFASTLIYGALVMIFELAVDYTPPGSVISTNVLGAVLLGTSVTAALVLWKLAGGMNDDSDPDRMQRGLIMMAAASEMPAVCGVASYLITGSLMWFAILLGASWMLFMRLGMSLPAYLNRMKEVVGRA